MTDVKRLLEQATPLPWRRDNSHHLRPAHIYAGGWHDLSRRIVVTDEGAADAALIVYAVNSLPAYEEAVDALAAILDHFAPQHIDKVDGSDLGSVAAAALSRLRGEK